ncbi:MAG TPA: helix-turn-helix transcriptional regulator [Solirubrobacterales bacterium]|nr:helix-turn-helix transcriptional regulator [Solirubrobacterales bacterium]
MGSNDAESGQSFGAQIRQFRTAAGMTQRQVASELGIDFTYLSKLENDRGEPPGEELVRRLAALLGADPEELLALAGKVPPQLRERAQGDIEFARFLRRLPTASEKELHGLYRKLNIKPPDKS